MFIHTLPWANLGVSHIHIRAKHILIATNGFYALPGIPGSVQTQFNSFFGRVYPFFSPL
jgi:hypothetical protein